MQKHIILTNLMFFPMLYSLASEKTNIVFFLVDDMGWMDVGYNGSNFYYTPTIDSLAHNGMIFNQAYAMPTSSPSRASYMSGLYPPKTGIYAVDAFAKTPSEMKKLIGTDSKTVLSTKIPTIAELLQNEGYSTCHIGKWHLGNNFSTYPTSRGFDLNFGGCEAGAPATYYPPYKNIKNLDLKDDDEYLTDRLTDEAVEYLQNYSSEKPFFLNMAFYAVHVPLEANKKDIHVVKERTPERGQNNYIYSAMVYSVDRSIKRILDVLCEKGFDKNTIIIFTSDNGGQSMVTDNYPLKGQKGNIYEGGIRVPTFIYWPGKIKPKSKCDIPITIIDYFPTVADIAGIQDNKYSVDGESLLPLILNEGYLDRKCIFWHLPNYNGKGTNAKVWQAPVSAVRKGDWKLIHNFEDSSVELYNLKNDISETKNLASEHSTIVNELMYELKEWQKKSKAPIPWKLNPNYDETSRAWITK